MPVKAASVESCRQCVYTAPLFEGLPEEELNFLAGYTSSQVYRKGETVFSQGEEIQFISFLKKGLLKFYKKADDNKSQIISIARPNDCVGLLGVFSDKYYQYSVSALEESLVYFIELSRVRNIVRNNGIFGLRMLGSISRAAETIINNVYDLSMKNLRGRIALILLEFADDIYHNDQFDLPLSRKEIGELIGMTTENVIRIFSEFRRDGIIAINGKNITLSDKALLMNIKKLG